MIDLISAALTICSILGLLVWGLCDLRNAGRVVPHRFEVVAPTDIVANETCVICLCKIDGEAKRLACNHVYHSDCIDAWASVAPKCPLCSESITVITI